MRAVVAALALAALGLVAAAPARAAPTCRPCDGLVEAGPTWRVEAVNGRETLEGHGDRAIALSVYRADGGQCCLERTRTDYPGVYLLGVDAARGVAFLSGHDAQWAALATDGIWSYDLASGRVEPVVARIWRQATCEGRPLRFAAILQTDAAAAKDASAPSDPYRGSFRLVAVALDAPGGPAISEVATAHSLSAFDGFYDEAKLARAIHWSADCATLTYRLSPAGAARTFRVPRATAPR
ncbi:MAG: hypothetical protein U1F43_06090 [Myxococcota bacterium]